MLSNLFASSIRADDNNAMLSTYLRTLKSEPSKLAKVLAALLIPAAALGWWYYSVAMSVDAVVPLNSTSSRTSDLPALEQQSSVEAVTDSSSSSTTTPLSNSSENIDVNISGNSPQTSVRIDGQSVPVPAEGSTHQVIQNDNGKTTVDINVNSNSSGTSSTRSSTKINLKSSSSSDVDIRSKEVQ
jgi:hypothetical protein